MAPFDRSHASSYWRSIGTMTLYVSFLRQSEILNEKRNFFIPHLHSTSPKEGSPSEYCHKVWYGKTRMATDWRKSLTIHLAISTQHQCVMDAETDRQISPVLWTDILWQYSLHYAYASHGKNKTSITQHSAYANKAFELISHFQLCHDQADEETRSL